MKTLLITAGLFFSIVTGCAIYFANSDPGNEYDLTLVVPIEKKDIPAVAQESLPNQNQASQLGFELRGDVQQNPSQPEKAPFRFNDRPAAPNEMRASE